MSGNKIVLKNNKGMSLLELLVVMVIIIMIMAMILVAYTLINRADVTRCAHRLENVLQDAKVTSMSKGRKSGTLYLYASGGNIYAKIGTAEPQLISGGGVFFYAIKTDDYSVLPKDTDTFSEGYVVFNTSGKLKTEGAGVEGGPQDYTTVNSFMLTKGQKTFYVKIYKETGYIDVIEASGEAGVTPVPTM